MRVITELSNYWNFHKGDIMIPRPVEKGPVYSQSKNERKLIGPASYYYFDQPDAFYEEREMRSEGWKSVNLPHDYIINQDNDPTQNNAHGYFKYENAWYGSFMCRSITRVPGGYDSLYSSACLCKRSQSFIYCTSILNSSSGDQLMVKSTLSMLSQRERKVLSISILFMK